MTAYLGCSTHFRPTGIHAYADETCHSAVENCRPSGGAGLVIHVGDGSADVCDWRAAPAGVAFSILFGALPTSSQLHVLSMMQKTLRFTARM